MNNRKNNENKENKEVFSKQYNAKSCEKKWQDFWEKNKIYAFNFNNTKRKNVFSIDTPPPTVSGRMHLGHAFSYSQADIIARYKRMRGFNVFYPFGFDDNGLATERFVEKRIGKKATEMKRSEFVKICLKETVEAEKELKEDFSSIGISCDWNINYRTIDSYCIKTSQTSFLELYNKGRAYRKESPTIWCPECQTAIAQVELEDKQIEAYFNYIYFEVKDEDETKKIIIATTRPELLAACVAVFVHPEDKRYSDLIGKKAIVPLFNYEVPILADSRVNIEKGTGIVMCCTFGDQTDMEWWKAYNLPLKIIIGQNGRLNEKAGKYNGLTIKEAREKIINDLKNEGLLLEQKKIIHTVNVHERCGTEIEFLITKQWFIKYLDLKEEFLKISNSIEWHPPHMKSRIENWIKGLQWDWCISRQRFFGVPFPVWYCKNCEEIIVAKYSELPVDPLEKKPSLKECPKCGCREFIPEKDVLDTWATSSLTPQIALKWVEDKEFFKNMFPMDLRPQGHDIISFWAFNTIVKSYFHEGKKPWNNIMIHGWALDKHGKKMSKSKGNVIEPKVLIEKYNADCLRFWASSSKLGEDLWFSEKEFINGQRLQIKLWNASKLIITMLKSLNTLPEKISSKNIKEINNKIDLWLLTKLNTIIKNVTNALENYEYVRLKLDVENFFWHDFCDNYLELVKDRFYNQNNYSEKEIKSAVLTLYNSSLNLLKLLAPIMPHITEEIYQSYYKEFEKKESIHLTSWPEYFNELEFKEIEQEIETILEILSIIRKFKSENKMSLAKEFKKLIIDCDEKTKTRLKENLPLIKPAARFKELEFKNIKESKYVTEDNKIKIDFEL
ncbi:MAG: valine--tRNA ligase [Candidatus Woesearchaeota archaeon]